MTTKPPVTITHIRREPSDEDEISQRPLQLALIWRMFRYTKPHARRRNWLFALVVLRSIQLPMLAWALGAVINGPISRHDPARHHVGSDRLSGARGGHAILFPLPPAAGVGIGRIGHPGFAARHFPASAADADEFLQPHENRAHHQPLHVGRGGDACGLAGRVLHHRRPGRADDHLGAVDAVVRPGAVPRRAVDGARAGCLELSFPPHAEPGEPPGAGKLEPRDRDAGRIRHRHTRDAGICPPGRERRLVYRPDPATTPATISASRGRPACSCRCWN
jgi:hypothetical protein